MKVVYIVCSTISELAWLSLAVVAPKWITPGYYWWTAFALLLMILNSIAFTKRLDNWSK